MESLITILRFVDCGSESSTDAAGSIAATGSILTIAMIVFLIAVAIVSFFVLRKNKSGSYASKHVSQKSLVDVIDKSSKKIWAVFFVVSAILTCFLVFMAFGNAFADKNNLLPTNLTQEKDVVASQYVNTNVYSDTGNIKDIEHAYIQNNSEYKLKLNKFGVYALEDDASAVWTVNGSKGEVYNNYSDSSVDFKEDYYINPGDVENFVISTDIQSQKAKELINKDVLKLCYSVERQAYVNIKLTDKDGMFLSDAKASFVLEDGTELATAYTDTNGSATLLVKLGTKGCVKIEKDNYEPCQSSLLIIDKNTTLDTFTTCYSLKSSVPTLVNPEGLKYNGENQIGILNVDDSLTYEGTIIAKESSCYEAVFVPAENHCWPHEGTRQAKKLSWSINKAELLISAENKSIVYASNFPEKDQWKFSYEGFCGDDDVEVLSGDINISTTYNPLKSDVNKEGYEVNFNESSLSAQNYNISYKASRLFLTQRKTGLSWGQKSWVYDGQVHSTTCTPTDLVNTDKVEVELQNNSILNVSDGNVKVDAIGLKDVEDTKKAANYFLDPEAQTSVFLSITQADPLLSVDNAAMLKNESLEWDVTYSGDASISDIVVKDENIATVTKQDISYKHSLLMQAHDKLGTTEVQVKCGAGQNYKAAECSFKITVGNIWGNVTSLQNLKDEEGNPKVKSREGIFIEIYRNTEEGEEVLGTACSDKSGKYVTTIDEKYSHETIDASIKVDVPGVVPYTDSIKIEPDTIIQKDIKNLQGLDFYTTEELKLASDKLSLKSNDDASLLAEFENYLNNDIIWYSNSNGRQSKEVKTDDVCNANPLLCNQEYKNSFVIDESKIVPQNQDLDQFLFMRIIGLNQDLEAFSNGEASGRIAGLTMQSIRSIPRAYPFCGHADVTWWGDSNCVLRKDLSEDGEIISHLNTNFKNNIMQVQKKTQDTYDSGDLSIKNTADKLFILSYSEMCTSGSEDLDFSQYKYYTDSAEGEQYLWYKNHDIQGNSFANDDLVDMCNVNSGEEIAEGNARCFQRTTYFDKGTYFLTLNYRGSIRTYAQSKERVGIVPAMCFGTASIFHEVNLLGDYVDYLDASGNTMLRNFQIVDCDSLSFKLKAKEDKTIESVTANGSPIHPDKDGIYKLDKVTSQLNIIAKTKGESDSPVVKGSVNFEKNIGDKKQYQHRTSGVPIKLVNSNGQILVTAITDENGNYQCSLGSSHVGENVHCVVDSSPGVLSYSSDSFELESGDNQLDINMHSLDAYTIEELKEVASWLSNNVESTESACYQEFDQYVQNDVIWYSNSNGLQPSNVSVVDSKNVDTSKCNRDYVCEFIKDKDGNVDISNVDNYLFLRIIGVNHDKKTEDNTYAGLTLQTIHALPDAYTMSSGDAQWWGNCQLRSLLQPEGQIYKQFSIKLAENICAVNKQSQKIRDAQVDIGETSDSVFLTSYSEMWENNGSLVKDKSWYDNTGNGTEGYLYGWYRAQKINGGAGNEILKTLPLCNSGINPGEKITSWERSVSCTGGSNYFMATDNVGSLVSNNYNFGTTGFAICFCL